MTFTRIEKQEEAKAVQQKKHREQSPKGKSELSKLAGRELEGTFWKCAGGRAWKGGTGHLPSQRWDLCYHPGNRGDNGQAFELGEVGLCLHFREQFPWDGRLQGAGGGAVVIPDPGGPEGGMARGSTCGGYSGRRTSSPWQPEGKSRATSISCLGICVQRLLCLAPLSSS